MVNQKSFQKSIGACPECDADIIFRKRPFLGQVLACRSCSAELEVIGLNPIELDWASIFEYDEDPEAFSDEYRF